MDIQFTQVTTNFITNLDNKRRKGTQNQGILYEIKICAILALRFANPKNNIKNFWITQNVDHPMIGNFDDIIIELETDIEKTIKLCLQLKHFGDVERKQKLKYSTFYKESANKKKGPFSLDAYYKSVEDYLKKKNDDNINYVIFTNKDVDEKEKRFIPCESKYVDLININGKCFYFKEFTYIKKGKSGEKDTEISFESHFLEKFIVLYRQEHEENLLKLLEYYLLEMFPMDTSKIEDIVIKFVDHITQWMNGNCGGDRILYKDEIIFKLGEFLTFSFIQNVPLSLNKIPEDAADNWKEITSKYRMGFIEACKSIECYEDCMNFVSYNLRLVLEKMTKIVDWNQNFAIDEICGLDFTKKTNVIEEVKKLWGDSKSLKITLQLLHYYFWKYDLLPLVLSLENENDLKIVLDIFEFTQRRFIIFFMGCLSMESKDNITKHNGVLYNYDNLLEEHKEFISNQNISFQGRIIKICDVLWNENIRSNMLIIDVVQILLKKFSLGENFPNVPEYFINRFLSNIVVDPTIFKEKLNSIIVCENEIIANRYFKTSNCRAYDFNNVLIIRDNNLNLINANKINIVCNNEENELLYSVAEYKENKKNCRIFRIRQTENEIIATSFGSKIEVHFVITTKPQFFISFLNYNNIDFDESEIYEVQKVNFKNFPITCRYIIISNELEFKRVQNKLDKNYNYQIFKLNNEQKFYLEFLGTNLNNLNVNKFAELKLNNAYNIEKCFHYNHLNIITGSPGIGKSTLCNYLTKLCPSDYWIVLITFNTQTRYFSNEDFNRNNIQHHIKYFLKYDTLKCIVKNSLLTEYIIQKKICFILDGFDEIEQNTEDKVCFFMKTLIELGYKLFVTTRTVKVGTLETYLQTKARTIVPFTQNNQFEYIMNCYKSKIENCDEKIEKFVKHLLEITGSNMSSWDLQFSGIPLQTVMISEIFLDECKIFCSSLETENNTRTHIDVLHLYEQFINYKISNLKCKDGVDSKHEQYFNVAIKQSLKKHKICAIKTIFSLDYPKKSVSDFLDEIKECKDRIGLIERFLNDDTPVFVHRTFAEYLVALFITENYEKKFVRTILLEKMFSNSTYDTVRQIFDRLLAKNCLLHQALLNKDEIAFQELILHENEVNKVDSAERNVLHLAMSWGARHSVPEKDMLFNLYDKDWGNFINNLENIHKISRQSKNSEDYIKLIVQRTTKLMFEADEVFEIDPLMYAVKVGALENINIFVGMATSTNETINKKINKKIESFLKFINDDNDDSLSTSKQLLLMCSFYDYNNLAELIINTEMLNNKDIIYSKYGTQELNLLHFSALFRSDKMVQLLIDKGVDVNIVERTQNYSPLYFASNSADVSTVKLLLDNGADVRMLQSEITFELVSRTRRREIVSLLEKAENKVQEEVQKNCSELFISAIEGNLDKVVYLVFSCNEDVNRLQSDGKTSLIGASMEGYLEIVQFLLKNNAKVDIVDNKKWSALMYASWKGYADVVKELLQAGADITLKDDKGLDAFNLAKDFKNHGVIKLLKYSFSKK